MITQSALVRLGLSMVLDALERDTRPVGMRYGLPKPEELEPPVTESENEAPPVERRAAIVGRRR